MKTPPPPASAPRRSPSTPGDPEAAAAAATSAERQARAAIEKLSTDGRDTAIEWAGAVGGMALGAIAGPAGVVVGGLLGAVAGASAGAMLDEEIGVIGGDLGAAPPDAPPARIGAFSAGSAGASPHGGAASEGPIPAPEED